MIQIDQGGAAANGVRLFRPPPGLGDLVEYLWLDDESAPPLPGWRIVADDAPHVIFAESDTGGSSHHRLTLVGPRSTFTDIDRSGRRRTVGARLLPGSLSVLIGPQAASLTDNAIPLGDIAPRLARVAGERLLNDPLNSAEHVSSLLRDLSACRPPIDWRAKWLAGRPRIGANRIDLIARELGISDRSLRDWSSRHLGMSLKRLLRIRRLHGSMLVRCARPAWSWSRVAAHAGYADQAHCARDFTRLLGEPPGRFAARAATGKVPKRPSRTANDHIGSRACRSPNSERG